MANKKTSVQDIFSFLCGLAPLDLQMDFDNSGFFCGRGDETVGRVLLSLDITSDVIEEAIAEKAELIVSHHPLLFHSIKRITDEEPDTKKILRLLENRIAVISMHTNLDITQGGVNDVLIRLFGINAEAPLDEDGCGRIGEFEQSIPLEVFLPQCKEILRTSGLRYYDAGRDVKRIAVMGGSGGNNIARAAALGCDTYITADIKYHQFLQAAELGINVIDGDHFCTENPVMATLQSSLKLRFPDVEFQISKRHHQTVRFC